MEKIYKTLGILLILGLAYAFYGVLLWLAWPVMVTQGLSLAVAALGMLIVFSIITAR